VTKARFAAGACAVSLLLAACGDARADSEPGAPAAVARLAAETEAAGRTALAGRDGWLFLTAELHHLAAGRFWGPDAARASRAARPDRADPLPAILDFRDQLAKAGIELLLVPVPPKAAVVPEELPDGTAGAASGPRLDAADAAFYALLRERGIEVLDLQPAFAAPAVAPTTFCKTDTHWSGTGIARAAERIAARVKAQPWYAGVAKRTFSAEEREVAIHGDLARMLGDDAEERVRLRFVSEAAAPGSPVAPSRESPLLLLGDSHTLVFHAGGDMHARGAGLPDQLALELGFAVDLVGVRGSGATPARINLARRKGGLTGKRLVVWCFAAREFTEAAQGWAEVPVVR
jgi:alginate O-acetyltransferase complex protein AlgJ